MILIWMTRCLFYCSVLYYVGCGFDMVYSLLGKHCTELDCSAWHSWQGFPPSGYGTFPDLLIHCLGYTHPRRYMNSKTSHLKLVLDAQSLVLGDFAKEACDQNGHAGMDDSVHEGTSRCYGAHLAGSMLCTNTYVDGLSLSYIVFMICEYLLFCISISWCGYPPSEKHIFCPIVYAYCTPYFICFWF